MCFLLDIIVFHFKTLPYSGLNTQSLLHQVEEKISREVLGKVFDQWFEDQLVLS